MKSRYLTARQAAEQLGVTTATLYAYVSRGLIRSEAVGGDSRARRYHADDVEKLVERKAHRHEPERAVAQGAETSLNWGSPVMPSALSLIQDQRLFYRGHDAIRVAETESFERVAALLMTGNMGDSARFAPPTDAIRMAAKARKHGFDASTLLGRLVATVMQINELDLRAFAHDPAQWVIVGGHILHALTYELAGVLSGESIAAQLAAAWCPMQPHAEALINAALILCADHELNASSFAARVAASTDANLYMAVLAGLAALSGAKHGGSTMRAMALVRELEREFDLERKQPSLFDVRSLLLERLRRGERLPGFGHRLYPDHDPRAAYLIQRLTALFPDSRNLVFGQTIIEAARELIDYPPNIDFALALLGFVLPLRNDAPFGLFALGRTAGWIAHAIEQYASDILIRPRARYVGVLPEDNAKTDLSTDDTD